MMTLTSIRNSLQLVTTFCLANLFAASFGMSVGGNLTIGESSDQKVFIDLFRQARPWQTKNADGSGQYNTEKAAFMPADTNGWPLRVPFEVGGGLPPQRAHTVIGARGAGVYHLTVEGKGKITFAADEGLIDPTSPFMRGVSFSPAGGSNSFALTLHTNSAQLIFVDIEQSDASDPIRNIRLFQPGATDENGPSGPFVPAYLDSIRNFKALRFMDMGHVNASPLETWEQRPTPQTYSQITAGGMAYEFMFDLANRVERSAYICVPHRADDEFVRQLARLALAKLSPNLKLFVEFSNETWNFSPGFDQAFEIDDKAKTLGLTSDEYTAKRSAEIWRIFEQEFGPQAAADRLIKVLASQAGRVSLSASRLEALRKPAINPSNIQPDALAIAPYFATAVANAIAAGGRAATVTVDEILDEAAASLRGEVAEWTRAHADLAAQHDLWLIDYEAGQHLAATGGAAFDDTLTEKLIAANRSPRMKDLYKEYLSQQERDGVLLTLLYYQTGTPSLFGSWGLLEFLEQALSQAPKWSGFLEWQSENPSTNIPPRASAGGDQNLVTAGTDNALPATLHASGSRDFDGTVAAFQWRVDGTLVGAQQIITTNLTLGRHDIELTVTDSEGARATNVATVIISPAAASQTLLALDFRGADPALHLPWTNTSTFGSNVTWSGLQASATVNLRPGSNAVHFWISGDGEGQIQTLQNSLTAGEYFHLTVSPVAPAKLDLRGATLQFGWRRLSGHAPRQWALFSSKDGFTVGSQLGVSETTENLDEPLTASFSLPFDGWGEITNSVEFRLVPFGERFHGHEAAIESLSLSGAAGVPAVKPPKLTVTLAANGDVEISWEDGPFRLLTSPALAPSPTWEGTSVFIALENGRRVARIPASARHAFYALQAQ